MPRLIDANAVDYENIMCSLSQLHWLNAIIENQPTVDAVEVVRCRDCAYWENGKGYQPWCNHTSGLNDDVPGDYFCSYGERKDDG